MVQSRVRAKEGRGEEGREGGVKNMREDGEVRRGEK